MSYFLSRCRNRKNETNRKIFCLLVLPLLLSLVVACNNPVKTGRTIGDSYGGGIIFYLDGKGGGLIAATSDQSTGIQWGGFGTFIGGADGTAIGTGKQNTEDIVAQLGNNGGTAYAAKLASDHSVTVSGVTYDDWFLPSKDELNELYKQKDAIGGIGGSTYWSSSEDSSYSAWVQSFDDGDQFKGSKYDNGRVRFVRAF